MDLYALNSAYMQVLPTDDQGRTVLSFESFRLHVTLEEQMRTLYYMLCVAAENPVSFKEGIVLLVILDSEFFLNSFGLEYMSEMLELFQIKAAVHVVLEAPAFDMPSTRFRSNIPIRLGSLISGPNVNVHDVSDNLVDIMRSKYGLTILPESMGGHWTLDDYRKWRIERHMLESSREFARVCCSTQCRDIVNCVDNADH
jgi:hypothetical protein